MHGSLDPFDPRFWHFDEPEVCHIALSDRWSLDAIVDPIDYEWAKQWLWCHTYGSGSRKPGWEWTDGPSKVYARRSTAVTSRRTANGRVAYTSIFLHREICQRANGPAPSKYHVADHLNSNSLDCRRINLRWATLSENAKNRFGSAWLQMRLDI